jgi:hypothetical protein
MSLPNIFDLCRPRDDLAKGTIADSDYAANLANVLTGRASRDSSLASIAIGYVR